MFLIMTKSTMFIFNIYAISCVCLVVLINMSEDIIQKLYYNNKLNNDKNVFIIESKAKGIIPNCALDIISRSEWNARPPLNTTNLEVNPPNYVVIHHSATQSCTTRKSCSASVRAFQNYHMDTNKWDDIGYNFVVGEDGNVYEGRGWGIAGAHTVRYNSKSIGICVVGTFTDKDPNDVAIQAVKKLIAFGVCLGKIEGDYKLIGHRQVAATACPGTSFYNEIKDWPHWTTN